MAYLQPGGVIGHHPATTPQLLLVVQGAGQVRGQAEPFRPIVAGQAAFWKAGEWHETRTETGLIAIIVESESLSLAPGLREINPSE